MGVSAFDCQMTCSLSTSMMMPPNVRPDGPPVATS